MAELSMLQLKFKYLVTSPEFDDYMCVPDRTAAKNTCCYLIYGDDDVTFRMVYDGNKGDLNITAPLLGAQVFEAQYVEDSDSWKIGNEAVEGELARAFRRMRNLYLISQPE